MRKLFKRIASVFLVPLTQWYLRKERSFRYRGTSVTVTPGVFHPGIFYSTKFLLELLDEQDLRGKRLLELGCGSGLISIVSAKHGANAMATDISTAAIENTTRNAAANKVSISILHSDLFESIPFQKFDIVVINPPYYAGDPVNDAQYAWYCGMNFEYFKKLFATITPYVHQNSLVIMVLTKGSDINTIKQIADTQNISFEMLREKDVLFDEKDYIFQLKI
ncbi:MAG: methyltransferase [Chryseolinea sp.]